MEGLEEKPLKQQTGSLQAPKHPALQTSLKTRATAASVTLLLVTFNCTCPLDLPFQPTLSALGYMYFLEQHNHVLSSLGDKIRNNLAAVFQISLNSGNVRCPQYEPEI